MAKNLKVGETWENEYGDLWDAAILVCDYCTLDFLDQTFRFRVDIYKDAAARTARNNPIQQWYTIDRPTFEANFDPSLAATTMKSQSEDYALLIEVPDSDPVEYVYGEKFE